MHRTFQEGGRDVLGPADYMKDNSLSAYNGAGPFCGRRVGVAWPFWLKPHPEAPAFPHTHLSGMVSSSMGPQGGEDTECHIVTVRPRLADPTHSVGGPLGLRGGPAAGLLHLADPGSWALACSGAHLLNTPPGDGCPRLQAVNALVGQAGGHPSLRGAADQGADSPSEHAHESGSCPRATTHPTYAPPARRDPRRSAASRASAPAGTAAADGGHASTQAHSHLGSREAAPDHGNTTGPPAGDAVGVGVHGKGAPPYVAGPLIEPRADDLPGPITGPYPGPIGRVGPAFQDLAPTLHPQGVRDADDSPRRGVLSPGNQTGVSPRERPPLVSYTGRRSWCAHHLPEDHPRGAHRAQPGLRREGATDEGLATGPLYHAGPATLYRRPPGSGTHQGQGPGGPYLRSRAESPPGPVLHARRLGPYGLGEVHSYPHLFIGAPCATFSRTRGAPGPVTPQDITSHPCSPPT